MKVIVRCTKNRVTKTEMEREIERLFQENKDLRVQVGHLRDELNLAQQQSETRRQKMVEKDKEIDRMRATIASVGADRDNFEASYKQVLQWWEAAQSKVVKAEATADEYRIALMESDCRVDELEKQLAWVRNKNEEWAQLAAGLKDTIAVQKEEKEALEDIIHAFEETRKDYEEEIHTQHVEKREWMQKYEELKAQKEADDKKSEEICAACNERYEEVLSERNHLRSEVVRLTEERNVAVHENTQMMFEINDLQDKWEAEHNLRVEAEKAYDNVASEAYDMHQQITNLIIDNTRLENKVEELEAEQDQTKYWNKKYNDLKENYDELVQLHREWGEEIDRLRKVVIELQTNRFTTDEFIGMIVKNFMPSADE